MIKIGLLDFLMNKAHHISVLNCSSAYEYIEDLFQKVLTASCCDTEVNLGIVYLKRLSNNNYLLIDGKRRLLSLMLLLKVISECQGEISEELSLIANQINSRYLKFASEVKLQMFGLEKTVYEKIINNEPLSYNEKQTSIYTAYDIFKENIKELELTIEQFYELFDRIKVNVVYIDSYNDRDIFYTVNKDLRPLNQLMLIKSYLAESHHAGLVDNLYFLFGYKESVFVSFLQSYLSPKFNRIITEHNSVYDYFVKYIETVKKYQSFEDIITSITKTAKIYKKMYNAEFTDPDIRNMFIKLVANDGKDTFSYLLELCEDYENKYLSKKTLLEIGRIINTYIWERKNKSSIFHDHFDFNQIVKELNQIIYDEQIKLSEQEKTTETHIEENNK